MRFAVLLLLAVAAPAQDIAVKADEYLNSFVNAKQFSGSVLIARDGKVLFSGGYGMANLEHNVPNSTKTKYRLGSITKQFAATAILQLEERGKLKVEDSICLHVTECPETWKPITIHNLLTHTSGIPNFTSFPEYRREWMLPSRPPETTKKFRDKPLDFPPGSQFRYSNSGYILLAVIIEKASGESWESFTRKNIFDPAGMHDSGHDTHASILPHRATGYWMEAGQWANSAFHDMSIPIGGGDLYSTVEDMLKWDQALYTEIILTKKSLDKAFTPFKSGYAYGWSTGELFQKRRIGHGGGINGFVTNFDRFPEERTTIVVLSNFNGSPVPRIARDLAAILYGQSYEPYRARTAIKLDPKMYDTLAGKYQLSPDAVITITREGDSLMTQLTGQGKSEVFPESENKFFLKVVDAQLTFHRDASGKATSLTLHQNGRDVPANRVE